jgi:ribosomal protein L34E
VSSIIKTAYDMRVARQMKTSRYKYYPCANCGQVVAHMKSGKPLHMHRYSKKCKRLGRRTDSDI